VCCCFRLRHQEEKLFRLGDRSWVRKQTTAPGEQITSAPNLSSLSELERMKDWSLIVLHNFSFTAAHESFASQLRKYIEEGGSVLFLPGDHTASIPSSLRDILPAPMSIPHSIRLQTVFVDPQSMAGATMLKTLQAYKSSDLPPLIPLFLPMAASIGGNVLLYGQASAGERVDLMKQHRFGLGRIVTLASNAFWRWGLQTEHDILPAFWLAVLYQCKPHLSKDEGELYTDGFLYEVYQPMKIFFAAKAGIGDATIGGVPVVISHATREETVWLNPSEDGGSLFETVYTPVEPGEYQLVNQLADASAEVRVEANLIELNDLSQNSRDLREIAENSGGIYANYQAWKALIDSLPKTAKTQIEEQNRFLGEKWWMVVLLIGLLGFEWYMRWRKGLP